ncbi:hypothetical protein [Methanococcoides burtonii]|uniref:Uncharacterized protein n=1 Tax=Methanococcoides burtonii (strain DSM 6242 / NBRC 107633 / OCM 468 / ACE-M) TaxID=259564 RepID=Q12ZK5_METBU|nr:hypothetical protein [Methanococcoides burtonii]ABE51121.1 Hypothetical protein Mbur_0103 [Methanococcoides burtonii DSM 6242]
MVTLIEKGLSCTCIFLIFLVCTSGCLGTDSQEAINDTVLNFLNSFNEGEFDTAFSYYVGNDFKVPVSLEGMFKNRDIPAGSIQQITLKDITVEEDVAYVVADCTVSIFENDQVVGSVQKQIYFRTQKSGSQWIITKVNFDTPISQSDTALINVTVSPTHLDPLVENAPLIGCVSICILVAGLIINKNNKSGGNSGPSVDISNAVPVENRTLTQFIKIMPPAQCPSGQSVGVDVWVKNFYQQPYENFVIIATFPTGVNVKKATLSFGNINPGESVKRTWKVTPNVPGWVAIEEPTVVFEFGGTRYSGQLDQAWLNVQ